MNSIVSEHPVTEKNQKTGLVPISQAFGIIIGHHKKTGSVNMRLPDSLGLVIAEDITAGFDMPVYDYSAMDGYAFCFEDTQGGSVKACGFIPAGSTEQISVPAGHAVRIMTGAVIPDGCDTVVPIEDISDTEGMLHFSKPFSAGDNIRFKGEDIRQGDTIIRAGSVLRPQEIALLSAMNITEVPVFSRARAAILATGNELLEPGSQLEKGKIINSNSNGLAAMTAETGAIPLLMGIAADTPDATCRGIESCSGADFILVTGGASAGDCDYVKESIERLGGSMLFSGVNIKPGKPLGFGILDGTPVFAIPGNPVAAMVTFELFVRPVLLSSMGFSGIFRHGITATLAGGFKNKGKRPHFAGARLTESGNGYLAEITGSQSSGRLSSLVLANCLLYLEPEKTYQAGDTVRGFLIDNRHSESLELCPESQLSLSRSAISL